MVASAHYVDICLPTMQTCVPQRVSEVKLHGDSFVSIICLIKVRSIFLIYVCCGQYFGIEVPKALV